MGSILEEIYDDLEDEHLNHFGTVFVDGVEAIKDLVNFNRKVKEIFNNRVRGIELDYAKYLNDVKKSLHGGRKKLGQKHEQFYPIIARKDNKLFLQLSSELSRHQELS